MQLFKIFALFSLFAFVPQVAHADTSFWETSSDGQVTLQVIGGIDTFVPATLVVRGLTGPCRCFGVALGDKSLEIQFPARKERDESISVEKVGHVQEALGNILKAIASLEQLPEVNFRHEDGATGFYFTAADRALWLVSDFYSRKPEELVDLFRKRP